MKNKSRRKIYFLITILVLINQFIHGKKITYPDKLEFIRSFIKENYPVQRSDDFIISTQTTYDEYFNNFKAKIGNFLPDSEWDEPLEKEPTEWLDFKIKVDNEYEIFELSAGGSGFDFLEKKKLFIDRIKKLSSFDFENIRSILVQLGAKYPIEPGGIFRKNPATNINGSTLNSTAIFYSCDIAAITSELINCRSFWKFTHINPKKLKLSKDPLIFYFEWFEDGCTLYWRILLNDTHNEYEIEIEPFSGYIIRFESKPYIETK